MRAAREPTQITRLFLVSLVLYLPLFAPRLVSDGAFTYEFLRSLAMDGDLNFDNERVFYTWRYVPVTEPQGARAGPRDTGYPANPKSVGPALFWFPVFVAGHAIAWTMEQFRFDVIADGYSFPERLASSMTGLPLSLLGLLLTVRLLQAWRSEERAPEGEVEEDLTLGLPVTIIVALASPLPALVLVTPTFAHTLSYLLATAFLLASVRTFGRPRTREQDIGLGLLLGLAALARPPCLLLAIVLAPEPILALTSSPSGRAILGPLVKSYLRVGSATFLAFSPHLASNLVLIGTPWMDFAGEMRWLQPRLDMALWDGSQGLYATAPLLLLATLSLPLLLRRRRLLGTGLCLALAAQLYGNAAAGDVSGVRFGALRFIETLPIFTVALAELCWSLRRRPVMVASILGAGALASFWSFLSMGERSLGDLSDPNRPMGLGDIALRNIEHGPTLLMRLAGRGLLMTSLADPDREAAARLVLFGVALALIWAAIAAIERTLDLLDEIFPILALTLSVALVTIDVFLVYSKASTRHVQAFLLDRPSRREGQSASGAITQTRHLALRSEAAYEGLLGGFVVGPHDAGTLEVTPRYAGGILDEAALQSRFWPERRPVLRLQAGGMESVGFDLVLKHDLTQDRFLRLPSPLLHIRLRGPRGWESRIPVLKDPDPARRSFRIEHADVTPAWVRPFEWAEASVAVSLRVRFKAPHPIDDVEIVPAEGVHGIAIHGFALEMARPYR